MKYFRLIITCVLLFFAQSCNKSKRVDLGNGYRFDYDPVISNDYAIFGPYENTYTVSGNVLKFDFDSTFIIAEQKPRDVILKSTYTNPSMDFKTQERIFKKSSIRQYWIINKVKDSVYGPYEKEIYMQKRKVLGVPDNLRLKLE